MKKIVVWLLCAALLFACAACEGKTNQEEASVSPGEATDALQTEPAEQPTAAAEPDTPAPSDAPATDAHEPTEEPTAEPAPESTETPAVSELPMVYNLYNEVGTGVSEAEMFRYDIDFDGEEEVISFRLDVDEGTTTILIDDREVTFDISSMLNQVVLIDLDPETPYLNLLVELDWGSDDYVTTEVHLENGEPVKGVETGGVWIDEAGQVIVYERCEFLGTRFFGGVAQGESLTASFDGWHDCHYPTEEEIQEEFDLLVDFGDLLHTTMEIPCTINGKNAKIAKDSYVYVLRINPGEQMAEISTLDGKIAVLSYTVGEDGWPYRINGVEQDECFDNILHAD